jgi:uncharacterized membrane protein
MTKRQDWKSSQVFWRAILASIVLIVKEVFDYEIPDALVDNLLTVTLWLIVGYGVRNNPSIKGEL